MGRTATSLPTFNKYKGKLGRICNPLLLTLMGSKMTTRVWLSASLLMYQTPMISTLANYHLMPAIAVQLP